MKTNIMILAGLLVLASCNRKDSQADAEKQLTAIEKGKVMATEEVKLKGIDDELVLNGDVMCDEALLRKVFVPCTGRISGLNIEIGDHVTRGQRLAMVHSEGAADYRKQLDDAEAEIRMAQRQYQMQKDLHQSGMASDKDVEEAREHLLMAKAELQRLRDVASINGYTGSGNSALNQPGKSNAALVAPISGYVISKRIYNDSYVSEETNNEAAIEIADLQKVWVIADVYESDISKIRQGARVAVTTMAFPDVIFHGRIDKIYSVLDSESKTMKVRVNLENKEGKLRPGMFASVRVSLSANGQRLPAVPSSAVIFEDGKDYVMVASKSKIERREVRIAHASAGFSFIASGVATGEKVITKNALLYFNASNASDASDENNE